MTEASPTGEWRSVESSPTEVDVAVRAAAEAAAALRTFGHLRTADLLDTVAKELVLADGELVPIATSETALDKGRLQGELARSAVQFQLAASYVRSGEHLDAVIDPADPHYRPAPRPDLRRVMIPLGPVGVFAASNFPFAFGVAGTDTAAALAAGCPVVAKAHPGHPKTSERLAQIVQRSCVEAGLPGSVFSVLHGAGSRVGETLVTHPALEAVAFTGSTDGGRALFDLAVGRDRPIPLYAEMGSVNPVCVFPHALRLHGPESLARDYVTSLLLGDGQFCTCPGIVAVPDSADGQAFFDSARQALADYLGATLLTDAIAASYRRGVARLLEHARGATASSSEDAGARVPGYLIELAVDDVIGHPALREEVFGPAGVLVRCEPERFIELVRAVGGSLTVTIHATEQDEAAGALAAEATRLAGRVVWNGWPTGVAVTRAMHHGGPWPATSSPAHTSVGVLGIRRFQRPVVFQETPDHVLPVALRDANPLHIPRCVDGIWTTAALTGREA